VTAVTSPPNIGLVRSLGADHVVDYTTTDFARSGRRYDLILDTVGNRSVPDLRQGRRHPVHQRGDADTRFAARRRRARRKVVVRVA
jgi:hypothetical protein